MIGVREGGTQAMRFDVVRVPAEQSLADYLNSGWMEGVDKGSTEDLMINGFPVASASANGSAAWACASRTSIDWVSPEPTVMA